MVPYDEVKVYNYARTLSDVQNDYNLGTSTTPSPTQTLERTCWISGISMRVQVLLSVIPLETEMMERLFQLNGFKE